jgi:hypothetical protein
METEAAGGGAGGDLAGGGAGYLGLAGGVGGGGDGDLGLAAPTATQGEEVPGIPNTQVRGMQVAAVKTLCTSHVYAFCAHGRGAQCKQKKGTWASRRPQWTHPWVACFLHNRTTSEWSAHHGYVCWALPRLLHSDTCICV